MLRLSSITKHYVVADSTVEALKGISLSFRKSEFVSILGPSGCGKTTLLNIIGGLDKYTSGDLFINGRSTKEFKDRDWDVYRNHRVGFIFQSYNLIPHQTILGNVELALTIAGIGKAERVRRAKQALDKVGLKGQYGKKPNQLSGGQCQRVAIARALVNDPEILLADEPTGALDTVTSVQIMELIREIAKDRLVIMVTHNPELAETYSTRIIKLLDGKVVDDNNAFSTEDEKAEVKQLRLEEREQYKKKEAELTAKLQKLQNSLENVQKTDKKQAKEVKKELKATLKQLSAMQKAAAKDDYLKSGKQVKKRGHSEKAKMSFWTAFKLSAQNLWTKKARTILTSIAGAIGIIGVSLVLSISCGVKTYISDMQDDMLSGNPISISQSAMDLSAIMDSSTFTQRAKAIKQAGLVNVDSMIDYLVKRSEQASKFRIENDITQEYVDFVKGVDSRHVSSVFLDYGLSVTNNLYTDFTAKQGDESKSMSLSSIKSVYTSILKQTDYKEYASLIAGLGRTFMQAPTEDDYILSQYNILTGKLAKAKNEVMLVVSQDRQLTDLLLTQLGYISQDQFLNIIEKSTDGQNYDASLDKENFTYEELLGKKFVYYNNDTIFKSASLPGQQFTYNCYGEELEGGQELSVVGILEPKDDVNYGCLSAGMFYTDAFARAFIEDNASSSLTQFLLEQEDGTFSSTKSPQGVSGITYTYTYEYGGESHTEMACVGSANAMVSLMGSMMPGGGSATFESYDLTAQDMGGVDIPYEILIYPKDFNHKDAVLEYLDQWNSDQTLELTAADGTSYSLAADQRQDITYTDNISIIISMVNNMIDIVTYALVGFTGLSLVVSCVMIAIITYVSVVERTKEIGVIRSLGGRKRDVSHLFNAETFIIGLGSGLIGIGVTYLLSALANVIIRSVSELSRIAIFPWHYAVVMVAISVLLTVFSGLIPSSAAARRDPVNALRTE